MIYVQINDNNEVGMTHFKPFDEKDGLGKTREELEASGGILVESLPEKNEIEGKHAVLKYEDGRLEYEYIDVPLTQEEELHQLKDKQALMQQAIDDLIFGGAF